MDSEEHEVLSLDLNTVLENGWIYTGKIRQTMSSAKAVYVLSLLIIATTWSLRAPYVPKMHEANAPKDALRDPCCYEMQQRSPAVFTLRWETTYGPFSATCERARAPVWVDRIWNLARLG